MYGNHDLCKLRVLAWRLDLDADWLEERAELGDIPSVMVGDVRLYNVDAVGQRAGELGTWRDSSAGEAGSLRVETNIGERYGDSRIE